GDRRGGRRGAALVPALLAQRPRARRELRPPGRGRRVLGDRPHRRHLHPRLEAARPPAGLAALPRGRRQRELPPGPGVPGGPREAAGGGPRGRDRPLPLRLREPLAHVGRSVPAARVDLAAARRQGHPPSGRRARGAGAGRGRDRRLQPRRAPGGRRDRHARRAPGDRRGRGRRHGGPARQRRPLRRGRRQGARPRRRRGARGAALPVGAGARRPGGGRGGAAHAARRARPDPGAERNPGRRRARAGAPGAGMNLIEDVLERFPASKPALLAIGAGGERRVWHFGELIARSAGLSGAFAARGVRRGDVVMTLVGNRIEWVLSLLACWRMGAIALPCNTQLRRHDLELRVAAAAPALCVADEALLAELPEGVPVMTLGDVAEVMGEERPQEPPVEAADLDPEDGALIVFTSGTTGEPRGALHAQRYLTGQLTQARHWLGAAEGELVWVTTATGWSKSARNVFLAPWLCGAAALIHEGRFEPEERLEIIEREGVNVLCQ